MVRVVRHWSQPLGYVSTLGITTLSTSFMSPVIIGSVMLCTLHRGRQRVRVRQKVRVKVLVRVRVNVR